MPDLKFNEFVDIVKRLRKECPWDREQTNESIKAATIEEAYEVVEAIEKKDYTNLKSELGDLLLHVVFHTIIASETQDFTIDDVINSIKSKLIRRHPHVFGEVKVSNSEEVKKNWEEIKLSEGRESILDGVPEILPALQRAHRLQEKAAKVGFDWEKKEDVWKKVIEEIEEMHEVELQRKKTVDEKTDEKFYEILEDEVGDVFFALVNYARFLGINPENALRRTNKKFIARFHYIEKRISETGKIISESNLMEMDKYWEESKKII
ncbi:MAG: nucleoside triphosphate pyrophosphohydrolase [Ignavibacteria bacterium]|nr:nucleoside triphosphate pyrophosphohydrolase [Ignavibacteria bacterium]MBT8380892.1 nucleoside triphosphate pyrophosphohydrolase [Ignavibacteria bacterium]MBT8391029.1 nucleoside triphosphate pyrophosphohydrolase [Ignavibacteria bacterium]NNJ54177.1 nucleoside triphosphate pyrophosphohydrolase [Ignavibacteriaceae bacterium]NNL20684.1 nucleoside triphosphate pyrophosphohydrolase [Ignavibacteriaceae bacterium]